MKMKKKLQQTVGDVLNKLPARQQEIIFLRFYEGLSYEEIADVMGIQLSSTYKLLYKALENLQQSLARLSVGLLGIFFKIVDPSLDHSEFLADYISLTDIPVTSMVDCSTR